MYDRAIASVRLPMLLEVEIVGELATALQPFLDNPSLHKSFVRTRRGEPYTVDGLGAMFRAPGY